MSPDFNKSLHIASNSVGGTFGGPSTSTSATMERLQNAGASLVTQSDPSRPSTSSSFQHWDETSQTAVSLKKLLGLNLTMPTLLHTFFKFF